MPSHSSSSRFVLLMLLAAALLSLPACVNDTKRTAIVNHPVFFTLNDPTDADELIRDCDAQIQTIPTVVSYYCGKPVDTGRATVLADYHVGLYVGFASVDGYRAYVEHPQHQALVEAWGPRCESIAVRDVLDEAR